MNKLAVITDDVQVVPARGKWRTTASPVTVYWCGEEIHIEPGFRFNGASIPFPLWWWVSPWDRWVILAACVHDYTYINGMFTRRECDRIFFHLLIHKADQSRWRWQARRRARQARIMYRAVRVFGALAAGRDW
jgi:hypothetical protein